VVKFLALGKTNKEVASELQMSVRTVESHRARIMQKMKFTSLAELVRFAIRNNWIEP
jgi:two-component system response regulator NreC